MTDIKYCSLLEILPSSIKDDEKIIALAKSLDVELQKLSAQTKLPLHLPRLEELPHKVLDQLAWQFNSIFYEPEGMDLQTKRQIVANSIHQWRRVGTPFAVRQMLDNFATGTQIQEWFQYGGGAYHFKLILKRLKDLEDNGETILRLINAVKNVRSWLDAFDFDLTREPPDEILHVAFFYMLMGKLEYDLNSLLKEKQNLEVVSATNIGGNIFYNVASTNTGARQNLYVAFHQFQSGNIIYNTEIEVDDNLWYDLWLNWLKLKWKNWHAAKIIWWNDEEIIDDDIIDEQTFEGNYIKLFLNYHNTDKTRLLVFPFPRDDITGVDINKINVDGLFVKRGYLSNKIYRAVYVDKSVVKLTF